MTVTLDLDRNANPSLLKKMMSNMKGVLKVSVHREKSTPKNNSKEIKDWIREMENFSRNFDSSAIDMNDERTKYIMRENS